MRDYGAHFFLNLILTVSLTDQIQLLYNYSNMFNQRTKGVVLYTCFGLLSEFIEFSINFER